MLVPLLALVMSALVTLLLVQRRVARLIMDRPNERSLHEAPVPRSGGIAIMLAAFTVGALSHITVPTVIWITAAALAGLSLLDDLRELPVIMRLLAHIAAGVATAGLLGPGNMVWLIPLALAIAWMINLYNFMDGSDGLAGGMALSGFMFYGMAAAAGGNSELAAVNYVLAGAAGGFLLFNFNPARIFLGDVGSVPLGFLAAALGLHGWQSGIWPAWFPVVVFSPFIVDATATLVRRALRRERVWQAHREHYYQRLIRMGWGHRRTALTEYALMLACGLAALFGMSAKISVQWVVLLGIAAFYAVAMTIIDRRWARAGKAQT